MRRLIYGIIVVGCLGVMCGCGSGEKKVEETTITEREGDDSKTESEMEKDTKTEVDTKVETEVETKEAVEVTSFKNPIMPMESPDPWVIHTESGYFDIRSEDWSLVIRKSDKLWNWEEAESKSVWKAPATGEMSQDIWAPELHFLEGRWYIYVAADDGANENHRMFVLEGGTNPLDPMDGEYVVKGKIADPSDTWAIDGTVLELSDKLYFIWSGWEGTSNGMQNLYIAPMSNPYTIDGERMLLSTPEEPWEHLGMYINEGPVILKNKQQDKVFLIYSASGSWTKYYCLGMLELTGEDPMRPESWTKSKEPVFQSSEKNKTWGVGHCSFLQNEEGSENWIVYHGMTYTISWAARDARAQKFTWNPDGTPNFGVPVSYDTEIEIPNL